MVVMMSHNTRSDGSSDDNQVQMIEWNSDRYKRYAEAGCVGFSR
jgi:hypothetical protein